MKASVSQVNPGSPRPGKDLRRFCLEALSIAAIITIGMTAPTWSVDQNPKGSMSQVVMYLLSVPARILFIFSGPEHYSDGAVGMIRFLMTLQWLFLSVWTGLA